MSHLSGKHQKHTVSATDAVYFSAASRNKGAILNVLKSQAPSLRSWQSHLFFLEIGSGSGEHLGHFAAHAFSNDPTLWQPSDCVGRYFDSIAAHRLIAKESPDSGRTDILPFVHLDVLKQPWTTDPSQETYWKADHTQDADIKKAFEENRDWMFDMVFSANMIHVAPYACTEALFKGAGSVLRPEGRLVIYGPFMLGGEHTSDSNIEFDRSLKGMHPDYGVRDVDDLKSYAEAHGLRYQECISMPANNFILIFTKTAVA